MKNLQEKEVLEQLKRAGQNMTAEDVRQQKISFIMGSVSEESEITRHQVEEYLDRYADESSKS